MVKTEKLIKLSIALLVGVAVTFAGVYAAGLSLQGPSAWTTVLEAFAMPLASLASTSGVFDAPLAYWLLVASGFLLWTGIGYLAGAQLLRRYATD